MSLVTWTLLRNFFFMYRRNLDVINLKNIKRLTHYISTKRRRELYVKLKHTLLEPTADYSQHNPSFWTVIPLTEYISFHLNIQKRGFSRPKPVLKEIITLFITKGLVFKLFLAGTIWFYVRLNILVIEILHWKINKCINTDYKVRNC